MLPMEAFTDLDLWLCPGCGAVRSDSPWPWRHADLLDAYPYRPGVAEFLATKPDPLAMCRDCNLNGVRPEDLHRFEAAVIRYAHMPKADYLRRRAFAVRCAQRAYSRELKRLHALTRAYNHLVDLDQLWYRNHPEDYCNTLSRAFEVVMLDGYVA